LAFPNFRTNYEFNPTLGPVILNVRPLITTRFAMGAWAARTFDNDTACDWSYGLEKVNDLSLVVKTLAQAHDSGEDYLDADAASEALGACEVIARLKSNWGPQNPYTETVDKWVKTHPTKVSPDLVESAIAAIDRILTPPSELLELWQETDDAEWREAVENLRARVQAEPGAAPV
jgi:hypothetical protein